MEEDASSDELNLTDSSAPIESPIKRSHSNNNELPWHKNMGSNNRQRTATKSTSKSKSVARRNAGDESDRALNKANKAEIRAKHEKEGVLVSVLTKGQTSDQNKTPKGKRMILIVSAFFRVV